MSRKLTSKQEWSNPNGDGFTKHGQHYKTYGACGYVNYHLIDAELLKLASINQKERRSNV